MTATSLQIAQVAAAAADSKKAEDIVLIDLSGKTDVCDYFLICTGGNNRQVDAIVDEVRTKVSKNCELQPISTEGREGLRWVLVDYGCVVIHVFTPEMRDFYRLERLWGRRSPAWSSTSRAPWLRRPSPPLPTPPTRTMPQRAGRGVGRQRAPCPRPRPCALGRCRSHGPAA